MSRDSERRGSDRHVIWFPVRMDADELGEGVAISKNVSQKGMLVASAEKFAVGAPVRVTFRVAPVDGEPKQVEGTIVRTSDNDEDPHGLWPYKMAVEFDEPVPGLEDLLVAAVEEDEG